MTAHDPLVLKNPTTTVHTDASGFTDTQKAAHQAVLHDYGLLPSSIGDPSGERAAHNMAFRNIVNLAANLFHAPIALINIADLENNCWSSHTKVEGDVIDDKTVNFNVDGSPIPGSFCQHVLSTKQFVVSSSTVDDARFANLPSVAGEPYIRFYVGIPLTVAEGVTVGSLCVMDTAAHPTPQDNQLVMFQQLAQLVINELNTQRTLNKQAALEQELLERDKIHQLVSQAFDIDIYSHNVEAAGNFVRTYGNNEVVKRNLGYSYEDIESLGGWHMLIHPEDTPLVHEHDQRLRNGQNSMVVYRMKTRAGAWCWLEDTATPQSDSEGRVVKLYGTARNITDWKTREGRLLLLESVVVNAKDAIVITDIQPAGDVRFPMRYVNQAHRNMTGYSNAELLGKSPKIFQGADTNPNTVKRINAALANFVTIKDVEILNYSKQGHPYWLELTIVPVADEQGNWQHFVSIQRDINERKRAEKRLQASLADKEMLLKEVHHRVKNNLQVMSSLLALQMRRLTDSSAKDALKKSRQRILAIAEVHKLLYEKSDFASFDMAPYLEQLTTMLVKGMGAHEVKVVLELEPTLVNIEQAIPLGLIANELITNALKYAFTENYPEPTLTIRLHKASTSDAPKSTAVKSTAVKSTAVKSTAVKSTAVRKRITLSIIDNGVGMPASAQQNDTLGMTIIQSMVSQINAQLTIKTQQGTHVTVTLPPT